MVWMIISIIILVIGLLNIKQINSKFDKPTLEELDSFQESVLIHIDEEISKYKKGLEDLYETKGKPMVTEINTLSNDIDKKIAELKEIEKRLDEKIIKYNNFKSMI